MASSTSSGSMSRSGCAANMQTKQTGGAKDESTSRNSRRPFEAPEAPQLSALLSSLRRPNDSTSVQSLLPTAGSTASSVQSRSAACESSTSVTTSSSRTSAAGGVSGVVVGQRIAKKRAAGGSEPASDDESDESDDGDPEKKQSGDRFDERQLAILNHWWNTHADHYPTREEKELLAIQSTPFSLFLVNYVQ